MPPKSRWVRTAAPLATAVIIATSSVAVGRAFFTGHKEWTYLARLDRVRATKAVPVLNGKVFVVDAAGRTVVVSSLIQDVPRSDRVEYCASSGWFESRITGSKFDRSGIFRLGPATRGLDRYPVRITHGKVYARLGARTAGPPRGTRGALPKEGPFCV